MEQRICDAYASVLGLSSVEPDAEFFASGGTSLLAMQVLALLNDLDIEAKDIFSLKTPHKIAKAVEEKKAQLADLSARISSKSEFQLLPYQRYYVDYQLYTPKGDGPNVPSLKVMPRSEIDPADLKNAVDRIIRHFSIFGMVFTFTDNGFVQRYEPERIQPVEIISTTEREFETDIFPYLLKPHRVINSLLYRCAIYVTETSVYLFMDFHHSIIDGTSLGLVMKNIIRVLHGEAPDKDMFLEYLRKNELSANRKGKDQVIEQMMHKYNLPSFDRMPHRDHKSRENRIHILTVSFDYTYRELMEALQGKNISLSMLFSAAGLLAMKEYNHSDKVQVQWTYNGRDEKWKQNIIGITMSALPIAVDFSRPDMELMKEVNAQIAENIENSDLSFALYDNSPNESETINMICEDGIEINTAVTQGCRDINMWDYRLTSPAAVECVLYPAVKENKLIMFINYNKCCYDEESMKRFGAVVVDCMRKLAQK